MSEEKVQVNGKVITSNAYNLKENDLGLCAWSWKVFAIREPLPLPKRKTYGISRSFCIRKRGVQCQKV
ncbi:MAG: hypothetical protein ACLS3U_07765 [Lachnospiraceae bacterium]